MYHRDHEGETVVYQWIECVREYIANIHGNFSGNVDIPLAYDRKFGV